MALSISITINGEAQVIQHLQSVGQMLTDFSDAMKNIGRELVSYYSNQVFASQGAVYGEQWAPLSAVTLAMRGAHNVQLSPREAAFVGFLHNKRGQDGTLASLRAGISARQPLVTGHPDGMQFSFYANADANSVVIGNSQPYFKYHQSTAPRTRLPRRQMLGINDDVRGIAQQLIQADIAAKIETSRA